ncbi:hypothetical protein Plim_4268 (plasmid) [Planctopirus limnophila DSM 3776]|uniref:Uncharacterized protein n=1 Tax=Planctopirus limnophila (strain ATCC 43296 / DSM 3776 / IFAM 1008 / Mu 290) TaxID=521674 RepID=D5SZF5_PLAL2|nr:hypothetical protein [Planctopirus limnophila]ADG70075.1 hypothetical protein Plim_4268 [Planctopirus limnophila DSM 3776]
MLGNESMCEVSVGERVPRVPEVAAKLADITETLTFPVTEFDERNTIQGSIIEQPG